MINKFLVSFSSIEKNLTTTKFLRISLLIGVFYHSAIQLPYMEQIWGPLAYSPNFIDKNDWALINLLKFPNVGPYYLFFIWGQLFCLLLAIFSIYPRLIMPIICFLTLNLNNKASGTLDGGNNLSEILLVYICFLNTSGINTKIKGLFSHLKISVHNMTFFIIQAQVALLYIAAIYSKLQGEPWTGGMALYYILQNDIYSQPWLIEFAKNFPFLTIAATYLTLVFQFIFPILIWFKKLRPYLIIAGVIFHMMIGVGMGLFTFGIFMCISYVIFFPESWSIWAFNKWKQFTGKFKLVKLKYEN